MSQHEIVEDRPAGELTDAEIETAAYRSGWRPLEDFRGNPDLWVDAKTFLERGEAILPIVRRQLQEEKARNGQLSREVGELKRKTEDMALTMNEVLEMARKSEGRGYERAKKELEARQREAVASGDVTAFDDTKAALEALDRENKPPPPPPARAPASSEPANVAPDVAAFVEANPWFTKDATLNAAMNAEHIRLQEEAPGLSLADNLQQAKEAVMARYPAKFGIRQDPVVDPDNPAPRNEPVPQRRTTVQRPTQPAPPRVADQFKIDSIQDPAERAQARTAFERQRRSMPEFTERDYMLLYNDPHADVVEDLKAKKVGAK